MINGIDNLFEESKTNHYGKTRIYHMQKQPVLDTQEDDAKPPFYKIILHQYHLKYLAKMKDLRQKPISINNMKLTYGLPNNLDLYFIVNPSHKSYKKPKTIHQKNAYILILFFQMNLDHANLFLESLNYPRLDSPMASNLAKCIRYGLSCSYTLEEVNRLLIQNQIEALF